MNPLASKSMRRAVVAMLVVVLLMAALWSVALASKPMPIEQTATATPVATRAAATATPAPVATEAPAQESGTEEATAEPGESAGSSAADAGGGTLDAPSAEVEEYNGMTVGFTSEGYPYIGDPAAPVVMVEWSDYLCPFCGRHFLETQPLLLDEYVTSGQLRMVFRDFPIPSLHPTAQQGHVAAHCVGENGPAAYWAMHDQLFGRQDEWNRVPDPADFLRSVADEVGADMDAYDECLAEGRTEDRVAADMQEGAQRGFTGTPTFVFGGDGVTDTFTLVGAYPVDSFRQYVDLMAAGEAPPTEPEPEAPQLPAWAQEVNLVADEENPGRNLYGDHTLGSDDALVTFIEFGDFQCPACALHSTEVWPQIKEQYVDTGLVRWVFKQRPLIMHALAPVGGTAAECAADEGLFWEMHDLLYAEQERWAPDDDAWTDDDAVVELVALAEELGLDADQFEVCINSRKALERVLYDVYDAEGIISSTPSFVVLYNGEGTLVSGSRPFEEFSQLIDSVLALVEEQE